MYKLRTDYLKDAPLHRSFGQMQKPYKYVGIHNAASSTTAKNLAIYIVYNSKTSASGTGIKIIGANAAGLKEALPNRTVTPFRKLV